MTENSDRAGPITFDAVTARLLGALSVPPRLHQLGPEDGRLALVEMQGSTPPLGGVTDTFHTASIGPDGLVGFRLYRPAGSPLASESGAIPAIVYVHGGRWVFGNADTHAALVQRIARDVGAAVFVPEYSRAPEARYPVALNEIGALLEFVHDTAAQWDVDPGRLAVAGDCAGATLATVAAQSFSGGLAAQALLYPLTDATRSSGSHRDDDAGNSVLDSEDLAWYWDSYVSPDARSSPRVSPLFADADTLRSAPQTLIIGTESDPARDEISSYATRLRAAGVAVTSVRYLGTVHDFMTLTALRDTPTSEAATVQLCEFLRSALVG